MWTWATVAVVTDDRRSLSHWLVQSWPLCSTNDCGGQRLALATALWKVAELVPFEEQEVSCIKYTVMFEV
jgi:hypothetical protein